MLVEEAFNRRREEFRVKIRKEHIQSINKQKRKGFLEAMTPLQNSQKLSHLYHFHLAHQPLSSQREFISQLVLVLSGQLDNVEEELMYFARYAIFKYQQYKAHCATTFDLREVVEILAFIAYETDSVVQFAKEMLEMVIELVGKNECKSKCLLLLVNLSYIEQPQSIQLLCSEGLLSRILDLQEESPLIPIDKTNILGVFSNLVACDISDVDLLGKYLSIVGNIVLNDVPTSDSFESAIDIVRQLIKRRPETAQDGEFEEILVCIVKYGIDNREFLDGITTLLVRVVFEANKVLIKALVDHGLLFFLSMCFGEVKQENEDSVIKMLLEVTKCISSDPTASSQLSLLDDILKTILPKFSVYRNPLVRQHIILLLNIHKLDHIANSQQFMRFLRDIIPLEETKKTQLGMIKIIEDIPVESLDSCRDMEFVVGKILHSLAKAESAKVSRQAREMLSLLEEQKEF